MSKKDARIDPGEEAVTQPPGEVERMVEPTSMEAAQEELEGDEQEAVTSDEDGSFDVSGDEATSLGFDAGVFGEEAAFASDDAIAEALAIGAYADEVARLTAERDEYLDTLRRLQAEFDNYRKRTARQQAEVLSRASESVIERLLPALDALDLALAHVGEREEPSETELAFVQIGSLLRDVLVKEGLERIDSTDVTFDPTVHDAVAHVPADEPSDFEGGDGERGESGPVVVEMLRPGYRIRGRVLRPAMVKVRA